MHIVTEKEGQEESASPEFEEGTSGKGKRSDGLFGRSGEKSVQQRKEDQKGQNEDVGSGKVDATGNKSR